MKNRLALLLLVAFCVSMTESALAATVSYEYDEAGRLRRVTQPDGSVVTYTLDAAGNRTSVVVSEPDTEDPTPPTNLAATTLSASSVRLTWSAATDNIGIFSYQIERCTGSACSNFVEVDSIPRNAPAFNQLTFDDTNLSQLTTYRYRLRARDGGNNDSEPSNVASVTTQVSPDDIDPTAPIIQSVGATASNLVTLYWTASTDSGGSGLAGYRIERCTGTGCSNFLEVGTTGPAATSFQDTSTAGSTAYVYRMRAEDHAGRRSTYSNIGGVMTPDTLPPDVPTNFTATAINPTRIDLDWTEAQDNGGSGVVSYLIHRCAGVNCENFEVLSNTANSHYFDTSASESTTYRYRIATRDHANLLSGWSGIATATTGSSVDTIPPTAPTSLSASAASSTQVNLSWGASTDTGGSGLASYRIRRCTGTSCTNFEEVGSTTSLAFNDLTTSGTTTYRYQVVARDGQGLNSDPSNIVQVTTPDTIDPTAPVIQLVSASTSNSAVVNWTESTDSGGSGLSRYRIERCTGSGCSNFGEIGTVNAPAASYTDSTTSGSTTYVYRVRAQDGANRLSGYSNIGGVTTPDTLPPNVPGNFAATAASPTQINLTWTAAADNGGSGIVSYLIHRCAGVSCLDFAVLANTANLFFNDTTASASSTYRYRIAARDHANLVGDWSTLASATTPQPPDTVGPNAPANFAVSAASQTSVNVSWTVATDTGGSGVASHVLERCVGSGCSLFTVHETLGAGASSFTDTGLNGYTTYRYRVHAVDVAANPGTVAGPLDATTPDSTTPTAPSNLSATSNSSSAVNLSWTAATDSGGSGLAHYRIERCVGAGCGGSSFGLLATVPGTSYTDSTVSGTVTYGYRVSAVDVANNTGSPSGAASVTTPDTIDPTPPTVTLVSPVTSTQVVVYWNAGSDQGGSGLALYRIERCAGSGCGNYSEIGTVSGSATNYTDNATAGSTHYRYRLRSQDGANRLSVYSNAGGDATPDTLGPTTPTNVGATAQNMNTIVLSWTASVDQGGGSLASYRIEYCAGSGCAPGTLFGHTANTSITHSVSPNTTYRYRVRALDVQSNPSDWSSIAEATTPFAPDNTPPSTSNASASAASSSAINVSWTVSSDTGGSGLAGYRIWRCIEPNCVNGYTMIRTFGAGVTSFQDTGLAANTWHRYYVTPYDNAGNQAAPTGVGSARTSP